MQHIYLSQGYDDELNIVGFMDSGFNYVYFQDSLRQWTRSEWRMDTPTHGPSIQERRRQGKPVKREDRTNFDSEEYSADDEGNWNS